MTKLNDSVDACLYHKISMSFYGVEDGADDVTQRKYRGFIHKDTHGITLVLGLTLPGDDAYASDTYKDPEKDANKRGYTFNVTKDGKIIDPETEEEMDHFYLGIPIFCEGASGDENDSTLFLKEFAKCEASGSKDEQTDAWFSYRKLNTVTDAQNISGVETLWAPLSGVWETLLDASDPQGPGGVEMCEGFEVWEITFPKNETVYPREGTLVFHNSDVSCGKKSYLGYKKVSTGSVYEGDLYESLSILTTTNYCKINFILAKSDVAKDFNKYFYYNLGNEQVASTYTAFTTTPVTVIDSYTYVESSSDTKHKYQYVHIKSKDEYATTCMANSSDSWIRVTNIGTNVDDNYGYAAFQIMLDENTETSIRNGFVDIIYEGETIITINIIQGSSTTPFDIDIDESDDDKYWLTKEGEEIYAVSALDINVGTEIDATALLFKLNQANVYGTIELKDNKLFLGNYKTGHNLWSGEDILSKYNTGGSNSNIIIVLERDFNYTKVSSSEVYDYIPDMTQNSQQKRVFKKGEKYVLGFVFVYDTGLWSSVYYLGDELGVWEPENDPEFHKANSKLWYTKEVRKFILSSNIATDLYNNDIIGIIPVMAVRLQDNVICQGFLSPAVRSTNRLNKEGINAQYSWFYRDHFPYYSSHEELLMVHGESHTNHEELLLIEIQELENETLRRLGYSDLYNGQTLEYSEADWFILSNVCTLNTPELEIDIDQTFQDSEFTGCKCRFKGIYDSISYVNNVTMNVSNAYSGSYFKTNNIYGSDGTVGKTLLLITDHRFISGYLWYGFCDYMYDPDLDLIANTTVNKKLFKIYPWNREIPGNEGPDCKIDNKRLLNWLYADSSSLKSQGRLNDLPEVTSTSVYRNSTDNEILRLDTLLYQGNIDYIIPPNKLYKLVNSKNYTLESKYDPYTPNSTYKGTDGEYHSTTWAGLTGQYCQDPISMRYKTSPHLVMKFADSITYAPGEDGYSIDADTITKGIHIVELYRYDDPSTYFYTDAASLSTYQWIKCGDLERVAPDTQINIKFEEGDYFYTRYDSLRTYYYTSADVNSVIEVVSGMICTRNNLDARYDRNRGLSTTSLNPLNFNKLNTVYNQTNNYFTFSYLDNSDPIYSRVYSNSILWSMTKTYGNEIDDWCNILDSNTLDLDGDKGEVIALRKLANNIICFQDTGISLILYNEKTLLATNMGVPVEIANSQSVEGKFYLYSLIGCQNIHALCTTPSGIYFVDGINKTLYLLSSDGKITDIGLLTMKSWELNNLDTDWWAYYDIYTQEILFVNEEYCLIYSDYLKQFQSFASYEGIYYSMWLDGRTYMLNIAGDNIYIWKKNANPKSVFFEDGKVITNGYEPCYVIMIANPYPTIDKTFTNIDYRADAFVDEDTYVEDSTFTLLRVWNEYQDTGTIDLTTKGLPLDNTSLNASSSDVRVNYHHSSILKKKFRIWDIQIPRSVHGKLKYIDVDANGGYTYPNIILKKLTADIEGGTIVDSRDRIRNPWCYALMTFNDDSIDKFIVHDISFRYFI